MNKTPAFIIGFLFVVFALWLAVTTNSMLRPLLNELENISYDYQLRFRIAAERQIPKTPIVIVDIDNKSLQMEGHWPWPRSKISELVSKLQLLGVNIIAFDIFFSEKQPNVAEQLLNKPNVINKIGESCKLSIQGVAPEFDDDTLFAKMIADSNTVMSYVLLPTSQQQNTLPPPLFQLSEAVLDQLDLYHADGYISNIATIDSATKTAGYINVAPDLQDGVARHAYLVMEYKGGIYPSLALQTALKFKNEKLSLVTPAYGNEIELEGLRIGDQVIPTNNRGQIIIPFIGKSHTFKYFSATDVLQDRVKAADLTGKIVILGSTSTGLGDIHAAAIGSEFPGVEVQATILNGILENNFSYIPAWAHMANLSIILFFGIIAALLFPYLGPRSLALLLIFMPLSLLFVNNWIWKTYGLILSFNIVIILGYMIAIFNIIYGYFFETMRRTKLKSIFGQYVPDEHIEEMMTEKTNFALHGEDREMTVMFADIRNFTNISESMTAAELVRMLNSFFTPMTEIIFQTHGAIDKYIGDNIMAFWGAPSVNPDHAKDALKAALEMQRSVISMKAMLKENNWPDIAIGVGINTGVMSVGDMGSIYRRNYTVLGDQVNLASRVEGLTKFYGVEIIVTETTQRNQSDYIFRMLDRVRVKGKKIGIDIYELIGMSNEMTDELSDELNRHHQALELYFNQSWQSALDEFNVLHAEFPTRRIYKLYVNRVQEYLTNPPNNDWDGVHEHQSK